MQPLAHHLFEELNPAGKSEWLSEQVNKVYLKQITPSTEYSLHFLMWLVKEKLHMKNTIVGRSNS